MKPKKKMISTLAGLMPGLAANAGSAQSIEDAHRGVYRDELREATVIYNLESGRIARVYW